MGFAQQDWRLKDSERQSIFFNSTSVWLGDDSTWKMTLKFKCRINLRHSKRGSLCWDKKKNWDSWCIIKSLFCTVLHDKTAKKSRKNRIIIVCGYLIWYQFLSTSPILGYINNTQLYCSNFSILLNAEIFSSGAIGI